VTKVVLYIRGTRLWLKDLRLETSKLYFTTDAADLRQLQSSDGVIPSQSGV